MISDLQPINVGEFVQQPVFTDIAEANAYMDEREHGLARQMEEEARRRMDADANDPTKQSYFMRLDKRTVIKDEREYEQCQRERIAVKVIPYSHAQQLVKEEEARKRQAQKDKRKKKAARQARKRNRR